MKTLKNLALCLVFVSSLAACGVGGETAAAGLNADYPDALSVVAQLAIGTVELSDTDLALDDEQAQELLTLWQAYSSLSTSDTAADEEVEGLLKQIQDTMDQEQIKSIAEMQLTEKDQTAVVQEMTLALREQFGTGEEGAADGPGGGFGQSPEGGALRQGQGAQGDMAGQISPEMQETMVAQRNGAAADRMTPMLVRLVVQKLADQLGVEMPDMGLSAGQRFRLPTEGGFPGPGAGQGGGGNGAAGRN